MTSISTGPVQLDDFPRWRELYQGYADFYQVPMTDQIARTVWEWLFDPSHPLEALIARNQGGDAVGLAHFRPMPRPLRGQEMGFLDDLFVDPAWRGHDIGKNLLKALNVIGRERGWQQFRWLTREDNYRARSLYDQLATRSMFLTYEMNTGLS